MGSTSSSFAALIKVWSLSAYSSLSAFKGTLSCPTLRGSWLRWPILTVMSISSSARMRAAYEVASSEFDMTTFVGVGWVAMS